MDRPSELSEIQKLQAVITDRLRSRHQPPDEILWSLVKHGVDLQAMAPGILSAITERSRKVKSQASSTMVETARALGPAAATLVPRLQRSVALSQDGPCAAAAEAVVCAGSPTQALKSAEQAITRLISADAPKVFSIDLSRVMQIGSAMRRRIDGDWGITAEAQMEGVLDRFDHERHQTAACSLLAAAGSAHPRAVAVMQGVIATGSVSLDRNAIITLETNSDGAPLLIAWTQAQMTRGRAHLARELPGLTEALMQMALSGRPWYGSPTATLEPTHQERASALMGMLGGA